MTWSDDQTPAIELLAEQSQTRPVGEPSDVLAVSLDADGCIRHVNQAFLLATGYDADAIRGSSWFDEFIPPRQRPSRSAGPDGFRTLVESGFPLSLGRTILAADGTELDVRWNGPQRLHHEGTIVGVIDFGRITNHGEASESRARYESIVALACDGIVTIDERGRIESFNQGAERIFGFEARDVIGQNVSVLMPEPFRAEHDGYMARYRRTGESRILGTGREVVGRRQNGETFPMDLSVSEVVFEGGRVFTAIIRDLTDRRRAETLAEVGTFASGLAHEIGTPMNIILGHAERLRMRTAEPRTQRGLDVIVDQVERVSRLMDQLLSYTRRPPLKRLPIDLRKPVRSVAAVLGELARERGVELVLSLPDTLPRIDGDSDRIEQVALNLTVNALDAMDPGGRLDLIVRKAAQEPGYVELLVRDDGVGIPADRLEAVFRPFASWRRRGRGSGLGLAVVRSIVHEHDGRIGIESRVGDGTEVRVRLPISRWSRETAD